MKNLADIRSNLIIKGPWPNNFNAVFGFNLLRNFDTTVWNNKLSLDIYQRLAVNSD